MEVGRPQRALYCPRCGTANPSEATSCRHCEQDLRLVAAAVQRGRGREARSRLARRKVLLGAIVLLLLVTTGGVTLWRVNQAREEARREAQINHYLNGVWAAEVGRWDLAVAEFAAAGNYRDAQERRADAERRLGQVEERYNAGIEARSEERTWEAAFALFQVVQALPNYRDAAEILSQTRAELGPLLLFRSAGEDSGQVVLSSPEGGEQESLGNQAGLPVDAEFSSDGRHFLYEIVNNGRSDLWLQHVTADGKVAANASQLLVAQAKDSWGRFSPDGNWVLYAWLSENGWHLSVIPSVGGEPARLLREADFVAGTFGPTAEQISFWAREGTRWRLGLARPASAQTDDLVPDADQFGTLEFSPDGRMVLYGYVSDGTYHLKLRSLESGAPIEPAAGSEFAWARFSPDGQHLLLWVWENHLGRLLLTDLTGRVEQELVSGAADAWGEFSPDGRQVVYGIWNGRTWEVRLAEADSDKEVVLAEAVEDAQATFAPKGRWLLYSLWRNGQWELVLRDLNDESERVVISDARFATAQFQPDNEHLLVWYIPSDEEAATLAVAEAVSGRRIALAQNLTAAAGGFSRDGRSLAVALQPATGATPSVYVANADGTGLLEFAPSHYRVYWARAPFSFGPRPPGPAG